VVAGHSAGGHLTAWTAGRWRPPRTSPLYVGKPLPIRAAMSIDGINDLKAYRANGPGRCGEPGTVDQLLKGAPSQAPYADTSPRELLPTNATQVVVSGELDPIVPVKLAAATPHDAPSASSWRASEAAATQRPSKVAS